MGGFLQRNSKAWIALASATSITAIAGSALIARAQDSLDQELMNVLQAAGFSGRIEEKLETELSDFVDADLADLGRLIFFDKVQGLHGDNSCAGCHAPSAGFGDFESIAIGVDNNDIVGPDRRGPRNQRRSPMVLNSAFYPKLMWNGRFFAPTGDPFDNSQGFGFQDSEGNIKFLPGDPNVRILLAAQGHIPGTELPEMAGFNGIAKYTDFAMQRFFASSVPGGFDLAAVNQDASQYVLFPGAPEMDAQLLAIEDRTTDVAELCRQLQKDSQRALSCQFDDDHGLELPPPEGDFYNEPIRKLLEARFNEIPAYKQLFAEVYPSVADGEDITFSMIAAALSQFQVSLTFADAPLDRFRRGEFDAMTPAQKEGALLFFSERVGCVSCHQVAGQSNDMFSDFAMHNIGVPQIAPARFGISEDGQLLGNVEFRDANGFFAYDGQYDFGLLDVSNFPDDISDPDNPNFRFRTSPLRNVALQPTYFHNGAFTRLEDAIRHHLDVRASVTNYDPARAGVDDDLHFVEDMEVVLQTLDSRVQQPIELTDEEFANLVEFARTGLLDPDATPEKLAEQIPESVPSGLPLQTFQVRARE